MSGMRLLIAASFQSRNRETFLFKILHVHSYLLSSMPSFNLVIERLFFSSKAHEETAIDKFKFQSRNRETFLFKPMP